ncbi:MAG: CCA tRNA nucleotidyltransferase [Oscillospiraceae bacterium]|nr:CCA tRNA nucleotidyltransferase [Oscillospiraceae bacterium]
MGGAVRDSLLGRPPHDWDVATSAFPAETKACFAGFKIRESGLKHGTITVVIDGRDVEITTFRVDGEYKDARRPESVAFVSDIRQDLARRDFTINALAYNKSEGLLDFFGGEEDLKSRRVACVGDADKRFREDALRIVRLFRFAAELGLDVDGEALAAAGKNAKLLNLIAKERISAELSRILLSEKPVPALELMTKSGIFDYIIPEFRATVGFEQHNPYHDKTVDRHIFAALEESPPDLTVRLALLLHDIAKPRKFFWGEDKRGHFHGHADEGALMAGKILRRLKYGSGIAGEVCALIKYHDGEVDSLRQIKRMLNVLGENLMRKLFEVKRCDRFAHAPSYAARSLPELELRRLEFEKIIAAKQCFSLRDLAVNGGDMIALGLRGSEIGKTLNYLLELVREDESLNRRETLISFAKQADARNPGSPEAPLP